MYGISRLQQIIKPVMHGRFRQHVRKHQAGKHSKGFGCHNLPVSMIYAHLSHSNSLRTPEQSFNANSSHHCHLNVRSIRQTRHPALCRHARRADAHMQPHPVQTNTRDRRSTLPHRFHPPSPSKDAALTNGSAATDASAA